jgi:phosphodiesterase/alkaline phosphatase D-like protein
MNIRRRGRALRSSLAAFATATAALLLPNDAWAPMFTNGPSVRVNPNVNVQIKWTADASWRAFVEVFTNAEGTGGPVAKEESVDVTGAPVVSTDHVVNFDVRALQPDTGYFFRITMTDPTGTSPIPLVTQAPLPPFFTGAQAIGDVVVNAARRARSSPGTRT